MYQDLFYKRISKAEIPRLTNSNQRGIFIPKTIGSRLMANYAKLTARMKPVSFEVLVEIDHSMREMEFVYYKSNDEFRLVYFPASFMNLCEPGDLLVFSLVDGGKKPTIHCRRAAVGTDEYKDINNVGQNDSVGEVLNESFFAKLWWADDLKRELQSRPRLLQMAIGGMVETAVNLRKEYFPALQEVRKELVDRMNGMIKTVQTMREKDVWDHWRDKPLSFLDGGVGRIDFLGNKPIMMRVGVFTVNLDQSDLNKRERFEFFPTLFGDLYRASGGNDEARELLERDSARMIAESAAAYRLLKLHPEIGVLLIHGPFVNTLSPYVATETGISEYVSDIWDRLVGPEIPCPLQDDHERLNFVPLYRHFLEGISSANSLAAGIIERSNSTEFLYSVLGEPIFNKFREFRFRDPFVLSLILQPGQYTAFKTTAKNDLSKAAPRWKKYIRDLPSVSYSYLQVNSEYPPFRVEIPTGYLEDDPDVVEYLMTYIHACACILTRYAFPVGLDIVDKYAKVPDWMSSTAIKLARQALYQEVIKAQNQEEMNIVLRIMSLQSRDFFYRPKLY